MLNKFRLRTSQVLTLLIMALFFASYPVIAQQTQQSDDIEKRKLWDEGLLKQRPRAKTPGARIQRPRYKRVTPPIQSSDPDSNKGATSAIVGVTVWKLRPSTTADEKDSRLLELEKEGGRLSEWTAERIEAGSTVSEGDRIRITIETPRKGYLYVIDREQYSDGSFSEPYLIFPTTRSRGGDNYVTAGRIIEIPSQEDNPPFFRLRRQDVKQQAEILTVLVLSQPIPNIQIGRNPIKLSSEQVRAWDSKWRAPVEQIEMVNELQSVYTKSEKEAGSNGSRLLTQDDPLPQTIYHAHAKPGDPLLVNVILRIAK